MDPEDQLTSLERQALDRLLEGGHPTLAGLRAQVSHLRVTGRKSDPSGFVADLEGTEPVAAAGDGRTFQILDVYGRVAGLDHDVGFILFVENGRLARLEGQPLEGDWPEQPRLERLFFVHPRIEGGSEMVETRERDLTWALSQGAAGGDPTPESLTGRHVLDGEPVTADPGRMTWEEPMDESTKVFLDPELTQKVPRDVLEQEEKARERSRAQELGEGASAQTSTEQAESREAPRPETASGAAEASGPEAAAEGSPSEDLPARRLVYLVGYNVFLGTLLALLLMILLPRAPYMAELSEGVAGLASGAVRTHLSSTLLLVALAGAAGALLANLWGLVRHSGGGFSFPSRLEIPFYVRPLAGALQGLLLFFAVHLALSALTMGTFTLAWVTLPGRMAYVALAIAAGFGVEQVTGKLREIALTAFSLRSRD